MRRRRRVLWLFVAVVALAAAVTGGLFLRLSAAPIALPFLDRPIANALGALAPELVAEVGSTALARAGRGVALRVTGARLVTAGGATVLSLPALAVRPSLGALLRRQLVIARIDVADAALTLTRGADGAWRFGGTGAPLAEVFGAPPGGAAGAAPPGIPRIHLARTELTLDDERAAGRLRITDGDLLVSTRDGRLVVTVVAGLDLEAALPPVPGRLRLPVRAEIAAPFAADGSLGEVTFTLTGEGGELAPAGDAGKPFAIAGLAAEGTWYPQVDTVRFARVAARVGGSRIDSKATVILGATPFVTLDGTVDVLPLAVMTRLWPAALAASVRTWLGDNLPAGTLRRCRVQLAVHGTVETPAAATPPKPPAYDIACDFDGVTAEYLRPLDPIREATGAARLTSERLQVDVGTGTVGACVVDGGTLTMDLTVDPPRARITAHVHGATADVLALVDRPPLELVAPLGILPGDAGGASRVEVRLRLPIASDVAAEAIGVEATAHLEAASLPNVAGGVGFRDGTLAVRVDGQRVTVDGTAALTGLAAVAQPVTVALDTAPGPTPAGRRATFALEGPDLVARGTAAFGDGRLAGVAVERLQLAGSDVAGTVRRSDGGRWDATLTGTALDLAALLDDPRFAARDPNAAPIAYAVQVDLDHVRGRDGRAVRDLRGTVAGRGSRVDAFTLDGSLVPSGTFHAAMEEGDGPRRVQVTSTSAASFLATFADLHQIVGGTLALDATTDARGPSTRLDGTLVVRDFKVVRAPVLAKILGIGSLGGIAALVQGEGLPVQEARFPFWWDGARITLADVRAIGAVGLTADGVFDTRGGTCDVQGNVIPAYSLNSALGKVPLVGRFLVGRKGDGVFGIDYRVTGKTADPAVRVNPLTSVAPTMLRRWFVDPFTRR